MARTPTNPRLWNLIVMQAKSKFAKYPSPAASHWVHERYEEEGGKFMDSSMETRRKELAARQFAAAKSKHHAKGEDKEVKRKKKGK